jgi:hypothetical protein
MLVPPYGFIAHFRAAALQRLGIRSTITIYKSSNVPSAGLNGQAVECSLPANN